MSEKQQARRIVAGIPFPITRKELYAKLPPIVLPSAAGIVATSGSGSRGTEFYPWSEKVGLAVSVCYHWPVACRDTDADAAAMKFLGIDETMKNYQARQDARDSIEAVEVREWSCDLNAAVRHLQSQRISRVK
jgi:hypothetical protein